MEVYANPAVEAFPTPKILGDRKSVDLIIEGRAVGQVAVADLAPSD